MCIHTVHLYVSTFKTIYITRFIFKLTQSTRIYAINYELQFKRPITVQCQLLKKLFKKYPLKTTYTKL